MNEDLCSLINHLTSIDRAIVISMIKKQMERDPYKDI